MSGQTSHQDPERRGVGTTAHAVAYFRHLESVKEGGLIFDPYAELLAGDVGRSFVLARPHDSLVDMVNTMAVRTKCIDDAIIRLIVEGNFRQVCVPGAGLDSRPWRLGKSFDAFEELSTSLPMSNVTWYEIDFPEMFEFKLTKLSESHAKPVVGSYISIDADLSIENKLPDCLSASTFDSSIPTLWLLEGFTGYLTEEELTKVFDTISEFSALGSILLVTFIGTKQAALTSMHKFMTDEPLEFCRRWGFDGTQRLFSDIASDYGKTVDAGKWPGYWLLETQKS